MEWNNTDSPVKKKFRAQLLVKKAMLTVLRDIKNKSRLISLKKKAIVNSASYYQWLRQNTPYSLNESSMNFLPPHFLSFSLSLSLSIYIYIYIFGYIYESRGLNICDIASHIYVKIA